MVLIETESKIIIFQMYGLDGAGPAPYQVLPCLVIPRYELKPCVHNESTL